MFAFRMESLDVDPSAVDKQQAIDFIGHKGRIR
jgi:hypothetical protein